MGRKPSKSTKRGKQEEISPKDLFDRYRHLKQFFETEWGRIGLDLRRVRGPGAVKDILKRVPGIESRVPFHDHPATSLIADGNIKTTSDEIFRTQKQFKETEKAEKKAWSDFHASAQEAQAATNTLQSFISQHQIAITYFPFLLVAVALSQELQVEKLTTKHTRADKEVKAVQKKKAELKGLLTHQQAWYARNELARFAQNTRYEKTAINYAKATAGLPEYSWIYSLRKCSKLDDKLLSSTNFNWQLFEVLKKIFQSMRRVDLRKTESRLRKELLKDDSNPMLRAFVSPNWSYMRQAFAQCRGKGFKRAELPYKIMGRYFENVERSKTSAEVEVARRNQLISC
jgi:hypothetical protein